MNKIINRDCIEGLKLIADRSVNCCVTSPPYFGLRDYGHEDQIGLEATPDEFVAKMVEVFTEVKRVLTDDGTLWLNLGDSYAAGAKNRTAEQASQKHGLNGGIKTQLQVLKQINKITGDLKPKDLIGIPWMVAFALRSSGWYLRQDIIWHKPNPMPESVTDRCSKAHEYIFLLSKSADYFYDADSIKRPLTASTLARVNQDVANQAGSHTPSKGNGAMKAVVKGASIGGRKGKEYTPLMDDPNFRNGHDHFGNEYSLSEDGKANKKSVWTVSTKPFSEAHFATFPEDLIVDCIKAGCPEFVCRKCARPREKVFTDNTTGRGSTNSAYPDGMNAKSMSEKRQAYRAEGREGPPPQKIIGMTDCGCNAGFVSGVVLDPFMGAGTTALVARKLQRNYLGFELNPEYIRIAEKRLRDQLGMFL